MITDREFSVASTEEKSLLAYFASLTTEGTGGQENIKEDPQPSAVNFCKVV